MGVDVVADCDFAAFVGIDWSEQKHVLALQDAQAGRIEIGEVFMLTKYKHLVIFPIHPATLANYRKSFACPRSRLAAHRIRFTIGGPLTSGNPSYLF